MAKQFAIGIDLGTTNSSLASIDLKTQELQVLRLPQWEGDNQIVSEERLPSFLWVLPKNIVKKGGRASPFQSDLALSYVIGREARAKALTEPDRVIHSAKSWLSSGSVHSRTAKSLPWGSASVEDKLSPIEAQSLYLKHMREAWDAAHPEAPFAEQAIVITVPASFDDLAQRLTLEACKLASYPDSVTLLEEPQAAFYDWHQGEEEKNVRSGLILVCDVGGGTSDFTLLSVKKDEVERLRVSEHILLGGDNIDLGIAHEIAKRLSNEELPRDSWNLLLAQTRHLKEAALADVADDTFHISIPKDPQKLFGDYYSASIPSRDLRAFILEGYFPEVSRDARAHRERQTALQTIGLPYAQDTAITRHLAEFLQGQTIDALLCVGGSLLPNIVQERLLNVLRSWQVEKPIEHVVKAASDLAVARGAARFAYLRASDRQLVRSAYPRTLMIELESQDAARYLTLIPRGHPRLQASRLTIPGLHLRVGSTVRFQLYSSLEEAPEGSVSERKANWIMLPPLETRIPKQAGKKVESLPVSLEATVRETGVLEIIARGEDQSWALDFPLEAKSDAPKAIGETTSGSDTREAQQLIRDAFAKGSSAGKSEQLPKVLEKNLGPRESWSAATLRSLWPALESTMFQRQAHEANWFYLAGYSLRPGWGFAGDEDRIASLLRIYDESFRRVDENARLSDQWCILWRRVAGGLPAALQQRLFERYMPTLRKDKDCSPEIIRLLGSLERLDATRKAQIGRLLVSQLQEGMRAQVDARAWALARVSSRVPLYAGAEAVLPPSLVEEWADQLESSPQRKRLTLFYAWAGRRTGDKQLDLDPQYRDLFQKRLAEADENLVRPVAEVLAPDARWQQQMFGESLPSGFVIY